MCEGVGELVGGDAGPMGERSCARMPHAVCVRARAHPHLLPHRGGLLGFYNLNLRVADLSQCSEGVGEAKQWVGRRVAWAKGDEANGGRAVRVVHERVHGRVHGRGRARAEGGVCATIRACGHDACKGTMQSSVSDTSPNWSQPQSWHFQLPSELTCSA